MLMLRRTIAILAVIVMSCFSLPVSAADDYPYVAYTTARVNLRSGASETSGAIATLEEGTALLVTGLAGDWCIVTFEGSQGFVFKAYLTSAVPVSPSSDETLRDEYVTLLNGDRGLSVRALQDALKELGFYKGEISGAYDGETFDAVLAFQKANGLSPSGVADPASQRMLYEESVYSAVGKKTKVSYAAPLKNAEIKAGKKGEAVKVLQSKLKELGYYSGEITGTVNEATVSAIRAFQKAKGLYVDGKAGEKTLAALYGEDSALFTPVPTAAADPYAISYPYQTTVNTNVNLRKGKGTSTKKLTTIPKGARVTVLSEEDGYVQLSYSGYTGYVPEEYVNVMTAYHMDESSGQESEFTALRKGDSGLSVKALQSALTELGFYSGPLDSVFGVTTQKAVSAFQTKNGMTSDGVATAEMQELIFTGRPKNASGNKISVHSVPNIEMWPLELDDTGDAVSALQQKLKVLGYYTGNVTGKYDKATESAVSDFQRAYYLTVDGFAGPKTLTMLNKIYDAVIATPLPTSYVPQTPPPSIIVPDTTPITADNVIIVTRGVEGTVVRAIQERLMELGYYTCEADGIYDDDDIEAIKAFQEMNHLTVDGVAGLATQNILFSDIAVGIVHETEPAPTPAPQWSTLPPYGSVTLRRGSSGEEVEALQMMLKNLGYFSGMVDGIFGATTEKAVKDFQKANGLKIDGIVASETLAAIYNTGAVTAVPTAVPATVMPAPSKTPANGADIPKETPTPRPTKTPETQQTTAQPKEAEKTAAPVTPAATVIVVKTATPAPTPTPKAGSVNVSTPTPRPTATPKPTVTIKPTIMPKPTAVPSPTKTPKPTATSKPTATPKPTKTPKPTATPKPTPTPKPTATPTPRLNTVLQRGNTGNQVKMLQQRLTELGYTVPDDGIFGSATQKQVISFQKLNGLTADGIAGKGTLTILYSDNAVPYHAETPAPVTPSPTPNATIIPIISAGATIPVITLAPDTTDDVPQTPSVFVPTAADVINTNWFTGIRAKIKNMPDVTVYDPDTGITYQIHLFSFGKHADGEPPTAVDTAKMNQVVGENTWNPHAVWVILQDGTVYLASTHSHGHGVDHTAGNNLEGHICIHFPRVMEEAEQTGPYAASHQKCILAEWERIKILTGQH